MKLLRKIAAYMLSVCISLPVMNAEAFSPRAESPPSYQLDNEMVMESNSMEKLLMEAAETNTENSDESTNSYSSCVTSIDMENGYADISFSCTQDALLITALYDEASGKMITSAQAEVTPSQNDAALYFDVMPEDYFIIRSYLVDPLDNAPLSEELESDIYTQEQQEFYHLTPEDFPEELVWQEDTASNNFAVFDENAVIVRYTEGHNILTKNDDTGIIIIQNADDAVKNLSENNALILFTEENTPVLLKADTVTVEENTVTMTEKEAALEDFFEIIRIHSGWVEPDFSEVEFGNGVTVTQDISAQNLMARSNIMAHSSNTEFNFNIEKGKATGTATYTYELGEIELDKFEGKLSNLPKTPSVTGKSTVSGEIGFMLSASVNCDWNKKNKKLVFGVDLSSEIKPHFEVNGSLGFDFSLIPKTSKKPTADLGYGFHAYIDPKVHIEADGSTTLDTSFTQKVGFSYDSSKPDGEKFVPLKETITGEVNHKIEGSFFIGLNLHPGIEWISDKLFDFSATEFGAGVLITGTLLDLKADFKLEDEVFDDKKAVFSTELSDKKERHLCQACIDGEVQAKFSLEIHLRILACLGDDTDVFPYYEVELPKIHIGYFYISLADETGKLQFKFGKGKCPNRAFLFHMGCTDSDTGKKIEKADITITDSDSNSASASLPTDVWLKPGTYQVTANAENYTACTPRTYIVGYLPVSKEQDFNMGLTKKTDSDGKVKYSLSIGGDMNLNDVEYVPTLNRSTENDTLTASLESQKYSLLVTVKDEEGNQIPASLICSYCESTTLHDVFNTLSAGRTWTETVFKTAVSGALNYQLGNYQKFENRISPSQVQYTLPKEVHTFTVTSSGYETGKFYVTMPDANHEETFVLKKKEEPTEETTEETTQETTEETTESSEQSEAKITQMVMGDADYGYCAVVTKNGSLYTWGSNRYGQVGHGEFYYGDFRAVPYKVMDNVKTVALDDLVSSAITEDGSLYMWGNNCYGQIGNGNTGKVYEPVKVMEHVKTITGGSTSAAITEDGSLYMWGANGSGQIGNGIPADSSVPIKVMEHVKTITVGSTSGAITEDGSLYMWGYNRQGQLGNGMTEDSYVPIKVMEHVKTFVLNYSTNAAITEDGSLYMWGKNGNGQLGNGTTQDSYVPVKVMEHVKTFSLDDNTSSAITEDGSLYMWGKNDDAQLGNGTTKDSYVPIKVMDNVKTVAVDVTSSAAITEDGSLYMWGRNYNGKLGNGTTEDSNIPVKIMDNVKTFSFGKNVGSFGNVTSSAITEDGSLYVWGANSCGQVGNGTTEDSYIPVKVMDNVKTAAFGNNYSVAITEDGNLYTWGNNSHGQLGNATTNNSSVPIKIEIPVETDVNTETQSHPPVVKPVSNVQAKSVGISVTVDAQTESFSDLQPDTLYNFYCKKSEPEALNAESLLYIGQYRSDANGNLQVTYTPKEACEDVEIFVVSDTQIQLIAAENTDNSVEITNLKQGETLNLSKENLISSNEDTARVSPAGLVTALNTGYTAIFSTESESPELVRIISVSGEAAISLGDVNQDGTINAKDAAEVLVASAKIGAGLSSDLTEEQEKNADVNHDGNVNAKDAALILTYAAEIGAGSFTGTMEEFMNGK